MPISPIHHRGDGEAAGEWGGCGGDRGHWRFWIGWDWEVGGSLSGMGGGGVRKANLGKRLFTCEQKGNLI